MLIASMRFVALIGRLTLYMFFILSNTAAKIGVAPRRLELIESKQNTQIIYSYQSTCSQTQTLWNDTLCVFAILKPLSCLINAVRFLIFLDQSSVNCRSDIQFL